MSELKLRDFYESDGERTVDRVQERIEGYRFFHILNVVDGLRRKLGNKPLKIVDAGAGWGQLSLALAEKGHKVYALDLAQSRLKRFKGEAKKLKVSQINSKLEEIPLASGFADIVVCSEVIEHMPEPMHALREFNRVLARSGFLVFVVPHEETLRQVICMHCNNSFVPHGHMHSFDSGKCRRMFDEAGFEEVASMVIFKRLTAVLLTRGYLNYKGARVLDSLSPSAPDRGWIINTGRKK